MMYIFADYHTHTCYSHGKGSVMENAATARKLGIETIAISDHGPSHLWGIGIAGFHILDQIRSEAKLAMKEYPSVQVLVGIEANVTSIQGDIDVSNEARAKLDILQVGLHLMVRPEELLDGLTRMGYHFLRGLTRGCRKKTRLLNTEAIVNAVYKNPIDVITHPGHRLNIDTLELARACVAQKTAFEINTSHNHTTVDFIRMVADQGCEFVIGSDAHTPERVGDFAKGIKLVKEAGLSVDQIRNAR